MSRLNDLIRHVAKTDPQLAKDLQRETDSLADRRAFGLNFERHVPEAVELPGRPARKNDKVRILPERGQMPKEADERLYRVTSLYTEDGQRWADVEAMDDAADAYAVPVDDLVVVAGFRDPIYPGLVSTGTVDRGGGKPFHTVINSENYHALQALLFTHRGAIDCIYIDPPYNTQDNDWKYNNNFVDRNDQYRHSKWLAFMERRLLLAKDLLRPDGVLIVTIDKNEGARLELLLGQVFPDFEVAPVHVVHNPRGAQGDNFSFVNETAYFAVPAGRKLIAPRRLTEEEISEGASNLRNWGGESARLDAANCFYPIYVRAGAVVGFGPDVTRDDAVHPAHNEPAEDGCTAVWPVDGKGVERKWRYARNTVEQIRHLLLVKELTSGAQRGDVEILLAKDEAKQKTVWMAKHLDASTYGTQLLARFIPGRPFPYPKSLYAVQDCLDAVVRARPEAVILDFFAGSGTTAHAVARLNQYDGGSRRSISVTNNEVSAAEQKALRKAGLRPGDPEWEALGICDFVTKPRISAAMRGRTPGGDPVKGEYKYLGEAPMSDGFDENVEFFTLTYESAMRVSSNREFGRIAPFLWLRSGSRGRRIDDISSGWDVADTYGVIANLDLVDTFIKAVEAQEGVSHAFIVTDEDRLFEAMARQMPPNVEPVRLYSSYLRNFEIEAGRAAR